MKTPFSLLKISALATSALLLTACIDDDDDSSSDHDHGHEEHAHSLMISRTNTSDLAVLEEGSPEALETAAAANSAELLLSNTGEAAAVITAGSVQFVVAHHEEEEGEEEAHDEEEHELPEVSSLQIDGTGIKVANTNGHFSVLATGTTQFVPYESLEEGATPEAEDVAFAIDEKYPALILDEEHEMVLAFDGANAVVYEGTDLEETLFACESVVSAIQTAEFVVVSCNNTAGDVNYSIKVEEANDVHTIEDVNLNIAAEVVWKTRANVFVGYSEDDSGNGTFHVLEENSDEELVASNFAAPENMCTWGIDSLQADIYTLTATQFSVYTHEGTLDGTSIALDETVNTADCEDLVMATATQTAFVLDNATPKMYEIDKEEDATAYHIHGREDLSVQDVKSAVSFHEVGEDAGHAHSHD